MSHRKLEDYDEESSEEEFEQDDAFDPRGNKSASPSSNANVFSSPARSTGAGHAVDNEPSFFEDSMVSNKAVAGSPPQSTNPFADMGFASPSPSFPSASASDTPVESVSSAVQQLSFGGDEPRYAPAARPISPAANPVATPTISWIFTVEDAKKEKSDRKMDTPNLTYNIKSKRIVGNDVKEYCVERKFADLQMLREVLFGRYPGVIVPPLPQPSIVDGILKTLRIKRQDADVDAHRRGIVLFLNAIGGHAALGADSVLTSFLQIEKFKMEAKDEYKEDLQQAGKQRFRKISLFGKKAASKIKNIKHIGNTSKSAASETGDEDDDHSDDDGVPTSSTTPGRAPPAFMRDAVNYASEALEILQKLKDQADYVLATEHKYFSRYREMGALIARLEHSVRIVNEADLATAFRKFGSTSEEHSDIMSETSTQYFDVLELFVYYEGLVTALISTIEQHQILTNEYNEFNLMVLKKKLKAQKMSSAELEKNKDFQGTLLKNESILARMEDELKKWETTFYSEFKEYSKKMAVDFRRILSSHALLMINQAQTTAQLWKEFIPIIHNQKQ